jgi:hypothetical protein
MYDKYQKKLASIVDNRKDKNKKRCTLKECTLKYWFYGYIQIKGVLTISAGTFLSLIPT